jgi:hypothetical protein
MSGRSCSAACAVFFTRDVVAAAEAPERGHAHVSAEPGEVVLQFGQGDVRNLGQGGMDQLGMGLGPVREPVAALRLWPGIAACGSGGVPSDGAGGTHAEALGGFAAGQTLIDGRQDT